MKLNILNKDMDFDEVTGVYENTVYECSTLDEHYSCVETFSEELNEWYNLNKDNFSTKVSSKIHSFVADMKSYATTLKKADQCDTEAIISMRLAQEEIEMEQQ